MSPSSDLGRSGGGGGGSPLAVGRLTRGFGEASRAPEPAGGAAAKHAEAPARVAAALAAAAERSAALVGRERGGSSAAAPPCRRPGCPELTRRAPDSHGRWRALRPRRRPARPLQLHGRSRRLRQRLRRRALPARRPAGGAVGAVGGGHEPAHGLGGGADRGGQRAGDRGHRAHAAAADPHQRLHHLPGLRRPGHGLGGGALRRHAGGAGQVAVGLLPVRVLDLGGRPVCHGQHRDPVRHRHRPLPGHHLTLPLPKPHDQEKGQGHRLHRLGHFRPGLLPAHYDALVERQERGGPEMLRGPGLLRLCHQLGLCHHLLHHLLLRPALCHDLCLPEGLQRSQGANEEN